jgi:transcriptional regulator with XRE-family HTH domain
LGEKLRYLREMEGSLRGLGRPMTQLEVAKAAQDELGKSISQSYLSQIESGARPHMTQATRGLLAEFFKVHPGFLVNDPEGFHSELTSDLRAGSNNVEAWLLEGAQRLARDPEISKVLVKAASREDARNTLILLGAILETPGLTEKLLDALKPLAAAPDRPERLG